MKSSECASTRTHTASNAINVSELQDLTASPWVTRSLTHTTYIVPFWHCCITVGGIQKQLCFGKLNFTVHKIYSTGSIFDLPMQSIISTCKFLQCYLMLLPCGTCTCTLRFPSVARFGDVQAEAGGRQSRRPTGCPGEGCEKGGCEEGDGTMPTWFCLITYSAESTGVSLQVCM